MTKPLVVLDCDGVILEFIAPFRRWLAAEHAITLRIDERGISESMTDAAGQKIAVRRFYPLLHGFFDVGLPSQTPIPGALEAIAHMQRFADVIILTNIPDAYHAKRVETLAHFGVNVPVYCNQGPKGPRLRELVGSREAVFVDDLPRHHESAATDVPHIGRLHMVGDPEHAPFLPPAASAHIRLDRWQDAVGWIETRLKG